MNCPNCGKDTRVVWSFPYPNRVVRQRQCKSCRYRFSTEEYFVNDDIGRANVREYRKILKERRNEQNNPDRTIDPRR